MAHPRYRSSGSPCGVHHNPHLHRERSQCIDVGVVTFIPVPNTRWCLPSPLPNGRLLLVCRLATLEVVILAAWSDRKNRGDKT